VPLRRGLGDALKQEHDLTLGDYGVLSRLAEQPGRRLRMSELADAILQPRSSLTRIADGQERRALIVREPSAEDARGAEAVLTKAGYAAFRRAQLTYHRGIRERFLARLSDEQIAQLGEAWAAIGDSGR
jgi:DNA-binding MarR family transcriptional regulator